MLFENARAYLRRRGDVGEMLIEYADRGDVMARDFLSDVTVMVTARSALVRECQALERLGFKSKKLSEQYPDRIRKIGARMHKLCGVMAQILESRGAGAGGASPASYRQGLAIMAGEFLTLAKSLWKAMDRDLKGSSPAVCLFDLVDGRIASPYGTAPNKGDPGKALTFDWQARNRYRDECARWSAAQGEDAFTGVTDSVIKALAHLQA